LIFVVAAASHNYCTTIAELSYCASKTSPLDKLQFLGRFQDQPSNVVLGHYWQDEQCLLAKAIAVDIASPDTHQFHWKLEANCRGG